MTDYTELVKALRCVEHEKLACPDCTERDCYANSGRGLWCRVPLLLEDAADAIEELQAEVERLKDCNEELREKQTFIDHYGTEWMTSAKDVPTAAYKHGYADGRDEALSKVEPKRGEWGEIVGEDGCVELYQCSECNAIYGREWNYCPNCGAKMTEVQDG